MAEGIVQVTEGSGKKLHTWDRTIGANLIQDEFVLPGEFPYASYFVLGSNTSIATANDHIMTVNAGASLPVRIRRIYVVQGTNATTAAVGSLELWRTTTAAPTGGAPITPAKYDTADPAAGCTAMTLPTVKATEGTQLFRETFNAQQTSGVSPGPNRKTLLEWVQLPGSKPIIIPAGTTNGIAIKSTAAIAAATVNVMIELVETNFV
jgi:hypothetical protein